ncbi:hypothetical protein N7533_009927 [Penicillium manginii]|uniref:uncharacterized protein n=2 Tax=Penicillium manginii TaxID=203109 RepID=UPI0025489548|nr:uncharacterized protein N7533_009927 [Penicillium manginii]KAJ5742825.1 hypothetical protein N7533_009927 [Penicillium manginii]
MSSIPGSTRLPVGNKDFTNATVVIIGAGISGMCMAIDLIKRNKCYNFVILEKSSSVGGTWNDNKYPGCCCDGWSPRPFYPRTNIIVDIAYLVSIAEKYGLYKHIRFNSTVEEARWDDEESKWKVSVQVSGHKIATESSARARYPGLKEFQGKMMHSARSDWSYNLKGKRIAIIGNGATAAQIIPEIAKEASHLTVFQRTPNWVIPRRDAPVSAFQQALLTYLPPLRWRKRALQMDFREGFHDAIFDELRERASKSRGAGEQEYDLIVLATGFKTVDFMYPIQVYGSGGRTLGDIWNGGAKAYYGMTVEDLPNFGMFYGPNTNLGHNSIILMIEAQSRYLNTMVGEVIQARQQGMTLAFKPKPSILEEYNDRIQKLLRESSFADPNCNSWYKQDDGNITNNWSGTVVDYQQNLSQVQWEDYIAEGSGKYVVVDKKPSRIGRVREETLFSDTSLLIGAASILAAAGGYLLARPRLMRA